MNFKKIVDTSFECVLSKQNNLGKANSLNC